MYSNENSPEQNNRDQNSRVLHRHIQPYLQPENVQKCFPGHLIIIRDAKIKSDYVHSLVKFYEISTVFSFWVKFISEIFV